jgi:hypothetical protein
MLLGAHKGCNDNHVVYFKHAHVPNINGYSKCFGFNIICRTT